jgi:hypothetical protein
MTLIAAGVLLAGGLPLAAQQPPPAQTAPSPAPQSARPCRATGRVTSGDEPLPGAAITARSGEKIVAITSSDGEGNFSVPLAPGTYTLRVELTAFATIDREIVAGPPPCEVTADVALKLASRTPGYVAPAPIGAAATPPSAPPATPPAVAAAGATTGAATPPPGRGGSAQGAAGQNAAGRGGRQAGPPRFETLTVQQSDATATGGDTVLDLSAGGRGDDPAARLLPPGFSLNAPVESVTVAGSMVDVDRNMLNDRMQALGRGEFGLGEGQFGQPGQQAGLLGGIGGQGGAGLGGEGGGRGGGAGGGRGGGLGGRIGGANRMQVTANYSMGGSFLDSAPYPLRDQVQPKRDYLQQTFSTTLGGALRIPGLYDGSRTTFNFSYSGSRNGNLFDQYATVPSEAFRNGDFSASPVPIVDPLTGLPFENNQIPRDRISETALQLLGFVPEPTLPGETRNLRRVDSNYSTNDTYSLRLTHSFTAPPAGRGGRGGPGGRGGAPAAGGGRAGAPAPATATGAGRATGATTAAGGATPPATGATPPVTTTTPPVAGATPPGTTPAAGSTPAATAGGRAAAPGGRQGGAGQGRGGAGGRGNLRPPNLNVTMNATVSYRRNRGDRLNVFPDLDGTTRGSTFSLPVTLNIRYGRSVHAINASFSRTESTTNNSFAFVRDVAGEAGIGGVATDPFDWGVPSITFGSFTAIRDVTPSRRSDRSVSAGYSWSRPAGSHNWRMGGDFQQQWNDSQSDSNARGTFTFTGLYTAGGLNTVRGSGQDFADFLLGLPQQATRSYSIDPNNIVAPIEIRGRAFDLYIQDDWRWKPRWTVNYGLRYDYVAPFVEANGHMVNLDANGDFTAVAPVMSGQTGQFHGTFPVSLVDADRNNLSPRVGVAWRATNRAVVRFGYGLSYNSGTYNSIARQLYQQPPFFLTGTSLGSLADPLTMADAFDNIAPSTVTNTFGIDRAYQLGLIHQWSADYGRDLFRTWSVGATYFGTRGSHLDMLRAPNRGPTGLRIEGVQAFTWQSSEGESYANGVTFRLQKRQTRGVAGNVTYTLSKARDNTTATGGGATVAQDDRNLDAEWAVSSFDRRHQVNGSLNVELPWGRNRAWLDQGGWLAAIAGGWSMSMNMSWQSGPPLTVRCSTCASDVARGTGGTLRADYSGLPIQLDNPTIDQFFNTAAFSVPAAGTFGNSLRNMVIGPGSHNLNANFSRDVALPGNRNVTIQVTASNLLNSVVFRGIDTNVNSTTFGQVTSVGAMRSVRVNVRFRY